jgi:hypothetical protein
LRSVTVPDELEDPLPLEGALSELVEVEARIELEVAEAEARAERLVEAARRESGSVELSGGPSLETARHALRASIEQECAALERDLAARAETEADRYRSVDEALLGRLAQWVASRVAGSARGE